MADSNQAGGGPAESGASSPGGSRRIFRKLRLLFGLARIEFYERLGHRSAGRLTAPLRRREAARARREVEPLEKWPRISDRSYATYTAGPNAVRINRLVRLIRPGRRVLDIGIGFGYVTGILLRDAQPSYYCGVDLKSLYMDATRSMIETNDLGDRHCVLDILDVFDIDPEFGRRHDPDLVLLLEVLEHVDDPVGALRAIRAAVRPGTEILFTVPLLGRLDGVWGHLSVFDRRRLVQICADAGLEIDQIEPLANTWSLVRARTRDAASSAVSPAVLDASRNGDDRRHTFRTVPIERDAEVHRRPGDERAVKLESTPAYLRCVVSSAAAAGGGARFEMADPRVARIELEFDPPDRARRLIIRGTGADGEPRMQWHCDASGQPVGERRTYVLVPGQPSRGMQAEGASDPDGVRWMEVAVEPEAGEQLTLTVYRAAYLGGSTEPTPA